MGGAEEEEAAGVFDVHCCEVGWLDTLFGGGLERGGMGGSELRVCGAPRGVGEICGGVAK